jgi:hypothetical protein
MKPSYDSGSESPYDEDLVPSSLNDTESHFILPNDYQNTTQQSSTAYEKKDNYTPYTSTYTTSNATTNTTTDSSSRNPKKYKRSISSKILDLQKECGFFRRPPPSLSAVVTNNEPEPLPSTFVHMPIPSLVRERPRGPPRRPPTRR